MNNVGFETSVDKDLHTSSGQKLGQGVEIKDAGPREPPYGVSILQPSLVQHPIKTASKLLGLIFITMKSERSYRDERLFIKHDSRFLNHDNNQN